MTREEVIGNLNMIRTALIDTVTVEQGKIIDDTFRTAIEALKTEPCEDAISRQAALGCCRNEWEEEVEIRLKSLPPVNPQLKTGHWIKISPAGIYECSECGQNVMTNDIVCYKYCHGCGAKMETSKDEREK